MNLFSLILEIKSGIQVSIGHPFLHIGVLQFKHLFASFKMLSISSNFIKSFLGILAYILYMFLHTKIKIFPKNILICCWNFNYFSSIGIVLETVFKEYFSLLLKSSSTVPLKINPCVVLPSYRPITYPLFRSKSSEHIPSVG